MGVEVALAVGPVIMDDATEGSLLTGLEGKPSEEVGAPRLSGLGRASFRFLGVLATSRSSTLIMVLCFSDESFGMVMGLMAR